MKEVIYISGPMSGLPDFNVKAFAEAERRLKAVGFKVVNPAKNGLHKDAPWALHMRADIAMLMGCDMVAMLPGWLQSKGALLEVNLAATLGMQCAELSVWLDSCEALG
jgi:hypothetical protein